MHFEDLWEKSENFIKNNFSDETLDDIFNALNMQLYLYKELDKKEISNEERIKVKSHLLGEVIFTITKISLKDNIDVFESLLTALKDHKNSINI
jgi:hypothetical protein